MAVETLNAIDSAFSKLPSDWKSKVPWTVVLASAGIWLSLLFYRLFLHPLACVPGPVVARLTSWWEVYENVWKGGHLPFELRKLHQVYGSFADSKFDQFLTIVLTLSQYSRSFIRIHWFPLSHLEPERRDIVTFLCHAVLDILALYFLHVLHSDNWQVQSSASRRILFRLPVRLFMRKSIM